MQNVDELQYVLLLFVLPRILQRFRLASAVTCFALGARSKAIATEIVALLALFFTLLPPDATVVGLSILTLGAMIIVLPLIFSLFASVILPYAPKSEFAFLLMVALVCAVVTQRLGAYYLIGAFVAGPTAQRFRVVMVPLRVGLVALHRRFALGEPFLEGTRIGIAMVPTLVFTLVIAETLQERFGLAPALFGALIVYTLVNTLVPGFILRLPPPVPDQLHVPPVHVRPTTATRPHAAEG